MKAKTLLILLLSSFILGCTSKKKTISYEKEQKKEVEKSTIDSVFEIKKNDQEIVKEDIKATAVKEEFGSDVSIIGKTTIENPFKYHNIVNGDTLQSISIFGTADFKINNHITKNIEKTEVKKDVEKLNIIQEIARNTVAKSTIKEVATEIKKVDKKINSKSFTFGAWLSWLLYFVIVSICLFLFYYFGGKINWKNIYRKIKDRLTKKR